MASDREVAGIRCMEVLARLDAYVDGELTAEQVAQIQAHVARCDWCAQFGGRYAAVVEALREAADTMPTDEDARDLARRLLRER